MMNNKGKVVAFERTGDFYCKLGLKHLASQRFFEAEKAFERSIAIEPDNSEYRFNLAGVLAEMGNVKESINILEKIIKTMEDIMPECYFALACNYFDVGNFQKSKENFEMYCGASPKGTFYNEAFEAIKFIETNILHKGLERQARVKKLANRGKELLDKFEFEKAIKILERVIKMVPESTTPRNNLSLAYYLNGDVGSAINAAREVLKSDKQNSYANCYLALFYRTMESNDLYIQQLKKVKESRYDSVEEILNAIDILTKMNEDGIIRNLLEMNIKHHDEVILWHFLAVSYHNLHKFSKAMEIWNYIRNKLPHMSIFTDCFVTESMKAMKNAASFSSINYEVKVFSDYIARIEELIKVFLDMHQKEFNKIWDSNDYVRDIINHFLYKLENKKKLKLIDKLANVADEKAIHMLNKYVTTIGRYDEAGNKCAQIVMRSKVAGDASVNIVELNSHRNYEK